MATRRIDWNRLRQGLVGLSRGVAHLTVRGFHAARTEASKDKYREYLSEAYGQMRERYPAVENTAREALDAIGVTPDSKTGSRQASARTAKKKSTAGKATRKKTAARKKTTRKTTSSKKKTAPRKKAA
jgi:hypothetical protein